MAFICPPLARWNQFDRPDSTFSGGGWTQHQVAIDALGIASEENSEESLPSFVKPKKTSPPRSPTTAAGVQLLARVSFVRPISVSPWNCYPPHSQGTDHNPRDRRDAGDPGAGSPDMTAAEIHHPHAFPSPPSGWSRVLGRGPGHLKLSTPFYPRDEICVAA